MSEPEIFDLNKDKTNKEPKELEPLKLLSFARWILIAIVVLAVLSCAVLLMYPGSKEASEVFEQARAILPPLVTLVLGFYFGGRHSR